MRVTVRNEISPALAKYRAQLGGVVIETLQELRSIIALRATTEYMREFRPDEVDNPSSRTLNARLIDRFVSRNNTKTLRRLTGRLTNSILGRDAGLSPAFEASSGNETINIVTSGPGEVTLTFGSRVPYAAIHEFGGVAGRGSVIPARPYMCPSIRDVEGQGIPGRLFDQRLSELAQRLNLGE